MLDTQITIAFGDLYGESERVLLYSEEGMSTDLHLWGSPAYASVSVGTEEITGPVVWDLTARVGWADLQPLRNVLVYAGAHIPVWLAGPLPGVFGWRRLDFEGFPIQAPLFEADILMLEPTGNGARAWFRTMHLPRLGRPLERMHIPLEDAAPATTPVRVLDCSRLDDVPHRAPVEQLVVHTDAPLDAEALLAAGWRCIPGVRAGAAVWGSLLLLSDAFETVSTRVKDRYETQRIVLRDWNALDPDLLPLLPEDVRHGIADALGIDSDAA